LGARAVHAIDSRSQHERPHFKRRTPKQGAEDNAKWNALLTLLQPAHWTA